MTNPVGSAIVNTVGPIRQIVQSETQDQHRYLVVMARKPGQLGASVHRCIGANPNTLCPALDALLKWAGQKEVFGNPAQQNDQDNATV